MNKWKLIYTVEFLTIKNNFNIGDIFFERQDDETVAIIEVESLNEEDAKRNGDLLLEKTINAMATITNQNMNITIKDISQVNSEVITFKSTNYLSAELTIVISFNHKNIGNILELIELSDDPKVAWVLELFNVDHPYNWVNMYRIYEVINSDINIRNQKWVTGKIASSFTHTANSPQVLGKEARHGFLKQEPPKEPMSIEDAKKLINDIFSKWIKHKKQIKSKELT